MKKRLMGVIAAALVLSLTLVGCGSTQQAPQEPAKATNADFKVGLVTDVGGLNDKSFNYLANKGLEQAKSELGITTSVVESKQMTDYVTNLSRFAEDGYNLVIAVGFLMHDAVEEVSAKYPNTKFLIIDSSITDKPNVTSALFNTEEVGYLVGVMAGDMVKDTSIPGMTGKNTISVVGGMEIPPVNDYIAGYVQGAKSVNPDVKILLNYTGKFDDPALGKQTALSQISNGADIVFQVAGGTGTGVINAAKEKGVYAIGVDADQNYVAPESVITSALKRVDTATYSTIKDTLNGNFKSGEVYFNLANDGVGYAKPNSAVPQSTIDKVDAAAKDIKDGKIKVSKEIPKL